MDSAGQFSQPPKKFQRHDMYSKESRDHPMRAHRFVHGNDVCALWVGLEMSGRSISRKHFFNCELRSYKRRRTATTFNLKKL